MYVCVYAPGEHADFGFPETFQTPFLKVTVATVSVYLAHFYM